jgi:hypothetical protein
MRVRSPKTSVPQPKGDYVTERPKAQANVDHKARARYSAYDNRHNEENDGDSFGEPNTGPRSSLRAVIHRLTSVAPSLLLHLAQALPVSKKK